jgi:methylase of polypeptide subunit release factors
MYFQEAIFTDYYADALAVAKKNYELLVGNSLKLEAGSLKKMEFIESDLLDFLNPPSALADTSPFAKGDINIVLVANLPYIPEQAFEQNVADNVKKWEPKPAFV